MVKVCRTLYIVHQRSKIVLKCNIRSPPLQPPTPNFLLVYGSVAFTINRVSVSVSPSLVQNWSIDYWLNMGVPKDKLVVGLATYGMSFTLVDPRQHGVHAPARGGGRMGQYTKETGILAYYEVTPGVFVLGSLVTVNFTTV